MKKLSFTSIITLATFWSSCTGSADNSSLLTMGTGSYAPADSIGVRIYSFNENTGEVSFVTGAKGVSNPSYITFGTDNHILYSVGEDGAQNSTVNRFIFNQDNCTLELVQSENAAGGSPCHIAIAPNGSTVAVANYNGGSVTVYPLNARGEMIAPASVIQFSGSGPDSLRQTQARLHHILFSPDSKSIYANDLGTDCIHRITNPIDSPIIKDIHVTPGAGPRHTAVSPDGNYSYTLSEISGEIFAFKVLPDTLIPIQTIIADSLHAEGSADIHISPDGQFLYASTRLKGDGIVIFEINQVNGTLYRTGYQPTGKHPRNFAITPSGKWLLVACRDTDTIEIYARDNSNGMLTLHSSISMPKPTCITFAPRQK